MHFVNRFITALIIAVAFLPIVKLRAQPASQSQLLANNRVNLRETASGTENSIPGEAAVAAETTAASAKGTQEQRKLLGYLSRLNIPEDQDKYNSRQKFYYHLAGVFAHLRLYPLAMKCFLKTKRNDDKQPVRPDTVSSGPGYLAICPQDDSVISKQAIPYLKNEKDFKSKRTNSSHIQAIFNDGKTAVGYAMLFHVKQPVRGKRKIFLWANTGHTFITLIKYNDDSTYVSASFGFYPVKDQLLSATPLAPTTSSTFKDDSGHKWDEVLGKFISRRRFERILALTGDYTNLDYDLSKNNCTDFGIRAADIAGIKVTETSGKWPLGQGNNPGVTGQSIVLGKFINADSQDSTGLFVDIE